MRHAAHPQDIGPEITAALARLRDRERAATYDLGMGGGGSLREARRSPRDAREARRPAIHDREVYPVFVRPDVPRVAERTAGRRPITQGDVAVSPKFKLGLTIITALAIGSLMFHLVWG